jgi:hypothetical protein
MELRECDCDVVDGILLAQDMIHWLYFVATVMDI